MMPMMLLFALCCINILLALTAVSLPLPDSGPHLANDWTQAVRLKHLYAAKDGLHLQIRGDGRVDGSPQQSALSE